MFCILYFEEVCQSFIKTRQQYA